MADNSCPCLSGRQCQIPKEEFKRKVEAKELEAVGEVQLTTKGSTFLAIFFPDRFGAAARHNWKIRVGLLLKKYAGENGFAHVRAGGLSQAGPLLDDLVQQDFTFFRERVV